MACEVESLSVACTSFTDHTASFMPVTGRHQPTERPSSSSPITKHEHHELIATWSGTGRKLTIWPQRYYYATPLAQVGGLTCSVLCSMIWPKANFTPVRVLSTVLVRKPIGKDSESGASIFQLIGFCVYTHGQTRGSDKSKKCQMCRDSDHDYSVGCNRHCLKPDIIATLLVSSYNLLLD